MINPAEFLKWAAVFGLLNGGGGGGGGVTAVGSGTGLTGGPITTSGSLSFAPIAANSLWANNTGSNAVPQVIPFTTLATALGVSNLGTMAFQDAADVNITGGEAVLARIDAPFQALTVVGDLALTAANSLTSFDVDTSSGVITIEDDQGLANFLDGMLFTIKNSGTTNNAIFQPFTGETIDGLSSLTITPGAGYVITKTAGQWQRVAAFNEALPPTSSPWALEGTNSAYGPTALVPSGTTNSLAWGQAAQAGTSGQTYDSAFAFGQNATAGAERSIAIGFSATALATSGVAIGTNALATNAGSMVLTDNNTASNHATDSVVNQFVGSFAGGYAFWLSGSTPTLAAEIDSTGNLLVNGGSFVLQSPAGGYTALLTDPAQTVQNLFTLPGADGTSGQVLSTDGSGNLSFITVGGGGSSPWTLEGTNSAFGPGASVITGTTNSLAWGTSAAAGVSGQTYDSAIALGQAAQAINNRAVAIGYAAEARGSQSTAIGNSSIAINTGSMVLGDSNAGGNKLSDNAANQFVGNFSGGYRFALSGGTPTVAVDINNAGVLGIYKGLRVYNPAGTFYAGLNAGAMLANVNWTLPLTDGTAGQFIQTNGAGVLSFVSVTDSLTNVVVTAAGTIGLNTRNVVQSPLGTYLQLALPATSAIGDQIVLINDTNSNATGFTVTQAAGQRIHFGMQSSTVGTGGTLTLNDSSLTVAARHSVVTLSCTEANTTWTVTSSVGNFVTT